MSSKSGDEPREALFRMLTAYRLTQALYVITRLGIPDLLAQGPRSSEELARSAKADPDRLFRLLRALASEGIFTLDDHRRIGLTPLGDLLRSDISGSLADMAKLQGEHGYRAFGDLLHNVETGETAFDHVYGMGHFDYLAKHPGAAATFHRAMSHSLPSSPGPLEGYDLRHRKVVVDVGGGRGTLLASVLVEHPHLRGILFDLPSGLVGAKAFLRQSGVADRCEVRPGDAFDHIPFGGDVYLLSRILHDWSDEKALVLLRHCRKAVPESGVLLLREGVLPEGVLPPTVSQRDLMMMVMNGGRERTESEWRDILRKGRFSLGQVWRTGTGVDLMEAKPK